MNRAFKQKSVAARFLILLSLIIIAGVADYQLFISKSQQAGYYEDLNSRLAHIRVSVTKLEYVLDMFVVAQRFEDTTVSMIQQDVDDLDLEVKELYDDPGIEWLVSHDQTVSEGLEKLSEDWFEIKTEVARLNAASTTDEVMLIHNAVDLRTIMITEKTDQLLSIIISDSKRVISELRTIMQGTIIVAIFFFLGIAAYLYKMVYEPVLKTASNATAVAAGWPGLRFTGASRGLSGDLTSALNSMLERIEEIGQSNINIRNRLAEGLAGRTMQIDVLSAISGIASRSIDPGAIYRAAVFEAVRAGRASAAAVYVRDQVGVFRLKAAEGFDDTIPMEIAAFDDSIYSTTRNSGTGQPEHGEVADHSRAHASTFFSGAANLPTDALGRSVGAAGFETLMYLPVEYDRTRTGAMVVAWSKEGSGPEDEWAFFDSLASSIGAHAGYMGLVKRAHMSTKFVERILKQLPVGVAVFDRSGRCVVSNSALARILGAPSGFDFSAEYRVADDTVFADSGVVTSIEKAYDGFSTEMIINYNPSLQKSYEFKGPAQRIRLKSLPLYDAGGEITEIALVCESAPETPTKSLRGTENS